MEQKRLENGFFVHLKINLRKVHPAFNPAGEFDWRK
jgi:hypothetical protein